MDGVVCESFLDEFCLCRFFFFFRMCVGTMVRLREILLFPNGVEGILL